MTTNDNLRGLLTEFLAYDRSQRIGEGFNLSDLVNRTRAALAAPDSGEVVPHASVQARFYDPEDGWGGWQGYSNSDEAILLGVENCEVRRLYPGETLTSKAPAKAEPECKCSMRTNLVGDGCSVCNPEYAAQFDEASTDE